MRIIYALPGNGFGGAQLSDLQLAADLRRRGHEVTLCFEALPGTAPLATRARQAGVPVVAASIAWPPGAADHGAAAKQERAFAEVLAALTPDLAMLGLPWPVNGLGLMRGVERAGAPTLVRFHCAPDDLRPSTLAQGVLRASARRGDRWIGVGESLSRCVEEMAQMPMGTVSTIRNGAWIPPAYRAAGERGGDASTRAGLGAGPGERLVVTVARLSPEKGVREYPEVVRSVLARRPETRFCWIGEGPQRPWLERELHARGVADHVHLPGWLDDVFPSLQAADAFFLPSRFEGMSLSILEAASIGLPIVCTDLASMREVLCDGVTALMCPAGDVDAYGRAIERIVTSSRLRQTMRRSLAPHAAGFAVEPMLDAFAETIAEIMVGAMALHARRPSDQPGHPQSEPARAPQ